MSIVVALEDLLNGSPLLYLIEQDEDGGSLPAQVSEALVSTIETNIRQLPTAPDQAALVRQIGQDLLALLSSHPDIEAVIRKKLNANRKHEEPIYLYFKHQITKFEHWPWEALYAKDVGFLAQDKKFAVARSQCCNYGKSEWAFEPPLRILAVLGASGSSSGRDKPVSGKEQWHSLRDAVAASGLPVELRVLTCERTLRNGINRERLDWAAADLIPPDKPARPGHRIPPPEAGLAPRDLLFNYIEAYAPHILHVFSHATADPNPQLQVGTYRDWELCSQGSILIEGNQLKERADSDGNIWLVTLNCCETAMNGPGTGALSMSVAAMLARQGVPAVVGMREQISKDFANAFSHLFYDALLNDLRARITRAPASGGLVDIHWACGLFKIRQRVADGASSLLEWTLPVMHTAYDFKLMVKTPILAAPILSRTKTARTKPAKGSMRTRATPKPKRLSEKQARELTDELLQLYEDRKLFVRKKPVVKVIDRRIATIARLLDLAPGDSHARSGPSIATGSECL
ncbi:CHAT domain-containing protein [Massilia sp.]|uniref:CHAT domain-containing protein n=1 Tax=Massilia sp. TaxID=1882437 RepID=UPI00391D4036